MQALARSLALVALGLAGAARADADLAAQPRILLLLSPTADDVALVHQHRDLAEDPAGLAERDVQVIEVIGEAPRPAGLGTVIRDIPADRFRALLIGRDGSEKLRSLRPVPLRVLFETIDAMPMRQAEQARRAQ